MTIGCRAALKLMHKSGTIPAGNFFKKKMHKKRPLNLLLLTLLVSVFSAAYIGNTATTRAIDYELHQTIIGPSEPVDVCPNIPGAQTEMPAGMELDLAGNCYTPTPPSPPVTVDLCLNIGGTQTTLPAGYYRTAAENCYPQPASPAEPIDVCNNLEDVQISLPDGYYLETDNTCQTIPAITDSCPNIVGPQATIPEGMVLENDTCFTPVTTKPVEPIQPEKATPLANIPETLEPIVQSIVNLVPESIQAWSRSVPEQVAKSVPYYIFGIVGLLAVGVLLQSVREAQFVRQFGLLLKRERDIAEQKDSFIALASHYLRTPLTLMQNGLDVIVSLKELPAEVIAPLQQPIALLGTKISGILNDIQQNTALKNISDPPNSTTRGASVLRSPFFWVSVVGSLVLVLLANFLLGVVGDKELGGSNLMTQSVFGLAIIVILYLSLRNLHVQRFLKKTGLDLVAHEKTIDEARNVFIAQATVALKESLAEIDASKAVITPAPSANFFMDGYQRFHAILEKFLLLGQVQTGADRSLETIDLRSVINTAILQHQSAIAEKNITISNTVDSLTILQNKNLFEFVINSVIDNAIKFNDPGGTIVIGAKPKADTLSIQVVDDGIGIDEAKIDQLFQPFSRATSTMEFNYEGLGFSLFLDKIIMDYTGGEIVATSELSRGTNLTVTTPLAAV